MTKEKGIGFPENNVSLPSVWMSKILSAKLKLDRIRTTIKQKKMEACANCDIFSALSLNSVQLCRSTNIPIKGSGSIGPNDWRSSLKFERKIPVMQNKKKTPLSDKNNIFELKSTSFFETDTPRLAKYNTMSDNENKWLSEPKNPKHIKTTLIL